MSDNAMLFSAPMVRAIEEGRKIKTRRTLYILRKGDTAAQMRSMVHKDYPPPREEITTLDLRYYWDLRHILSVGDRIWTRESWRADKAYDSFKPKVLPKSAAIWYEADGSKKGDGIPGKLRPSIFLPRWASRTT